MTQKLLGRLELQVVRDSVTQQRKIVFRNQNGDLIEPADHPELMATLAAGGITQADLSAALATKANASSLAAKADTTAVTAAIAAQHTADNGTYASKYLTAGTASATKRLVSKLRRGVEDANWLIIGDSTGNDTNEWVYLAAQALAARFPAYTVTYRLWDATSGTAYQSTATIQTGTGSKTLAVYNASIAGTTTSYVQGTRFPTALVAAAPDLISVSHGHNTGDPGTTERQRWNSFRDNYLAMLEELVARFPRAGVMLIAQNPSFIAGRENWQAIKATVLEEIAQQRGFGVIDVHQAFADLAASMGASAFQAAYMLDTTHPNPTAQQQLWLPLIDAAFRAEAGSAIVTQPTPPLLQASGRNLLPNSDFSSWTGAAPDNWVLTGCTATKDTTFYETGTYSCRLDAPASAGTMQMEYSVNTNTAGIKSLLDGQVVTLAARVYIPAANATTPSFVVKDQAGSSTQSRIDTGSADQQGRWIWVFVTRRFADPSTVFTVDLLPRISGTSAGTLYVDRVYATIGELPRCGG